MGLGKTFTGAEKMHELGAKINLVICQKSKIADWIEHFKSYYDYQVFNLTKAQEFGEFHGKAVSEKYHVLGVINYELAFRRAELLDLTGFTLMLDESSMIQNEAAKRAKFVLKMKPKNVILLSGTPTGGKYERLWSQLHLLGWNISKQLYWSQFVNVKYLDTMGGYSIPIVTGYKNVERLKRKMADYGCQFLKSEDVFDLPEQTFSKVNVSVSADYKRFRKTNLVTVEGNELVGDTTLTRMLYERQLCGMYSKAKIEAFRNLLENTDDRLIVFYNFNGELIELEAACNDAGKPFSLINGQVKNLEDYENKSDSVTLVQYQAGAMGLNLQKANKIIYFSLPLSSELFEQSKKRIHRIGQSKPCFYYLMVCKGSIEERILKTLEMRKDYTEKLFEQERS